MGGCGRLYTIPHGISTTEGLGLAVRPRDTHKILCLEARPADQRAIHVRNSQQLDSIRRLHRPPIENPDALASWAEPIGQSLSDNAVDLGDIRGRRSQTCADCPDRL